MNKPFLFIDFYRTVSFDHLWSTHPRSKEIGASTFCEGNRERIAAWMRGECTAEVMVADIAKNVDLSESELWESLVQSATNLVVLEETIPLIKEAKKDYRVVLFTDNFDTFTRFTVPGNPSFYTVFDGIINSADTGILKCDQLGKSFLNIARDLITQSILVDDSDSSKETFEALGGKVFQVGTAELTMEALRSVVTNH